MVTVWGHPDPTTSKRAAKYMNGINWKMCVDSCFKDATCLLAYGNSSEYCGMYTFGDVSKVENLETVALDKIYLEAVDYATVKQRCVSMDGAFEVTLWVKLLVEPLIHTIHFGIELTDSNTWTWTLPELMVDDSGYVWAENEPNPEK
ncbi:hypothetical protein GCK72_020811 [Caenorhabditis remanei]|uniref:PAN-3 domain-containing protein n=1 Tax=Caenorhabditis remanei TaxID=31234 RepID=A0A6A5GI28_CAERE|nr:hypothetical protein GCK72_020811 [Caenorhabditis remanei]KAF1754251.1 hypothetical protein GCK72_020811 [Caenorhabditis remanei]